MFKNDVSNHIAFAELQASEQQLTESEAKSVQGGFFFGVVPGDDGCIPLPPIFGPKGPKLPWPIPLPQPITRPRF